MPKWKRKLTSREEVAAFRESGWAVPLTELLSFGNIALTESIKGMFCDLCNVVVIQVSMKERQLSVMLSKVGKRVWIGFRAESSPALQGMFLKWPELCGLAKPWSVQPRKRGEGSPFPMPSLDSLCRKIGSQGVKLHQMIKSSHSLKQTFS